MISRRALLLTTALLAAAPCGASAAEPFDEAAFAAAQGAGRPIIVEVTAPWCPICKTQRSFSAASRAST